MQNSNQSINKIWLIVITAIITSIVLGGGIFIWQKIISRKETGQLKTKIIKLQKRINDLADKERTRQEFIKIFPIIENKLPRWFQDWQTMVLGFNVNSFTWQEDTTLTTEQVQFNSADTVSKLRKSLYIYSPDKSKFLDIYIGMELWEEGEKIKAGYGPDHAVALGDLKTNQLKILLFCGTTGNYDNALWLDNDKFIVTGFSEYFPKSEEEKEALNNKVYYVAFLYFFNLPNNKMTLYYGPKVEGTFFKRIYLRSLREQFRTKFPDIIFD